MELKIGEYIIPEGCTIKREGNTIKVYQKKQIDPKPWVYCPCCKSAIEVEYWKDYE